MEHLVEQVRSLRLHEDDVIIVTLRGPVTFNVADRAAATVRDMIAPRKNKVLVVQRGVDIAAIGVDTLAAISVGVSGSMRRLQAAERTLIAGGYSYLDGAEMWKPPLGLSARPLLDLSDHQRKRITELQAQRDTLRGVLQEMVTMMDSGDEHGAGMEWHTAAKEALASVSDDE